MYALHIYHKGQTTFTRHNCQNINSCQILQASVKINCFQYSLIFSTNKFLSKFLFLFLFYQPLCYTLLLISIFIKKKNNIRKKFTSSWKKEKNNNAFSITQNDTSKKGQVSAYKSEKSYLLSTCRRKQKRKYFLFIKKSTAYNAKNLKN